MLLSTGCCSLLVFTLAGAGCPTRQQDTPTVRERMVQSEPVETPSPTSAPAKAGGKTPKPGRPIALVNNVPIERQAVIQTLIEANGLRLLQRFVLRELARQEAEKRGITVTPADVDREYDLTLHAARYNGKDTENITPARREKMIEDWTRARGVTREELQIAMEQQATLRKLVQDRVVVQDEMLEQEYKRVHEEKVVVRHIQLAAPRVWVQVKSRLDQGEAFETLVRDYSQNSLSRDKNGLLPAFSRDDPSVPSAFIEAAFAMEPGQVCNPIEAEGSHHVLKLEQRIPATNADFEEVKEKLRENVHARLSAAEMERLGERLLMRAKLQIKDATLREQYERGRESGEVIGPALERD
jgi:foldase protein PrsA